MLHPSFPDARCPRVLGASTPRVVGSTQVPPRLPLPGAQAAGSAIAQAHANDTASARERMLQTRPCKCPCGLGDSTRARQLYGHHGEQPIAHTLGALRRRISARFYEQVLGQPGRALRPQWPRGRLLVRGCLDGACAAPHGSPLSSGRCSSVVARLSARGALASKGNKRCWGAGEASRRRARTRRHMHDQQPHLGGKGSRAPVRQRRHEQTVTSRLAGLSTRLRSCRARSQSRRPPAPPTIS